MYIVLVKDEKTGEEGRQLLELLYEGLNAAGEEVSMVELSAEDTYEECLPFFLEQPADVVVTADMAGFSTLNAGGETVFNSMYCKCIHILTKEPWYYPDELLKRMNFTASVCVAEEWEKEYIERHYENVPRVVVLHGLKRGMQQPFEEPEQIKRRLSQHPKVFAVMAERIMAGWKEDSVLPEEIDNYLEEYQIPATEDEIVEVCVLLKDIPLYFQMEKRREMEKEKVLQSEEALIISIISLIREG